MVTEQDLKALEFDVVRRLLERLAATPYGAEAARGLVPAQSVEDARRFQNSVSAARRLLDAGSRFPAAGTPDVRAALRQARTDGAVLSGLALHHLVVFAQKGAALAALVQAEPALYDQPPPFAESQEALAAVASAVTASGQVVPTASARLAELHEQWRGLRDEIQAALMSLAAEACPGSPQEIKDLVVWPSGRGALSVPPAVAETLKGVRRGAAPTGRKQIVEPMVVVGTNNRLEALQGQIDAEQTVIRRELTAHVQGHLSVLDRLVAALTWIDLAFAAGQLSAQFNASAPTLVDEPVIELDGAYHPALLLQMAAGQVSQAAPLSLRLRGDHPLLIVTGPNTGGKTVALKTVGLLAMMAAAGLHVPAEGACVIGRFHRLVVGIGDPQSLQHHLSTFAGHVQILKRLMEEADRDTLVLIDELGTGTDPEEGAALAMAVLDELATRRVPGLITTHLPPLKAYRREGVATAAMEFDEVRLEPTYRLILGGAGASHGLTIAGRQGLPEFLIARARGYLARSDAPEASV